MYILHTTRLSLREMTPDDAEQAYLLNLDPEVIRYTGDGPFDSAEAAREFLQKYDHYHRYGFGRWAVELKESHTFLGWCGLKFTESLNEYDVGFRFFKKYWNQGYASEAARACLATGFEKFGMPEIVGRAMQENVASIRVLEKIGMKYRCAYDFDGESGVVYAMTREEWTSTGGNPS